MKDHQIRHIAQIITVVILFSGMLGLLYYSLGRTSDTKTIVSLICVGVLATLIVQRAGELGKVHP